MMEIRRALPADRDALFDVWWRSVQATHHFVSRDDLTTFAPMVRDYLAAGDTEFWVLELGSGPIMGFMGLGDDTLDSLFLAPECHRRGGGRAMVRHAAALRRELTVAVNEQNVAACQFYLACGFVVTGRSDLDETGRPYPLVHMRLVR